MDGAGRRSGQAGGSGRPAGSRRSTAPGRQRAGGGGGERTRRERKGHVCRKPELLSILLTPGTDGPSASAQNCLFKDAEMNSQKSLAPLFIPLLPAPRKLLRRAAPAAIVGAGAREGKTPSPFANDASRRPLPLTAQLTSPLFFSLRCPHSVHDAVGPIGVGIGKCPSGIGSRYISGQELGVWDC